MKINMYLIIIILIIGIVSCSDEKESPLFIDNNFEYLKNDYNISENGLSIDGFSVGIDTTLIFINGRMNKKLWVGCYNKNKTQLFEWVENVELDTAFYLNTGYGNYSNFKILSLKLINPNYANGIMYFILRGSTSVFDEGPRPFYSDLYVIKGEDVLTKKRHVYPEHNYFQDIFSWFNGFVVISAAAPYKSGIAYPELDDYTYTCYSALGDSLYTRADELHGELPYFFFINKNVIAINNEEYIMMSYTNNYAVPSSLSLPDRKLQRVNLRTNKIIWYSELSPFKDIPRNARLDSTNIVKANNIWEYSNYITLFDGNKTKVVFELNIESGDFIIKK